MREHFRSLVAALRISVTQGAALSGSQNIRPNNLVGDGRASIFREGHSARLGDRYWCIRSIEPDEI